MKSYFDEKYCIDCIGCMTVRFYGHQMNFSIVRVDEHLLLEFVL